jgi:predicted RNase H-like HicB family nuclease
MEEVILTAVIQELPDSEGGGYWAFVEELPGAITQGKTLEEIRENLQEAVGLVLEYQRERVRESLDPNAKRTFREKIRVPA